MKRFCGLLLAAALLFTCLTFPTQATQTKLIAITFDDGPDLEYTPQVLDILESRHARATFFVVGKWLPGKQALLDRISAEGHQIGNHTFSHQALTGLSEDEIVREVRRADEALENLTGQSSYMVRPPYGLRSESVIRDIPAPVILWSIDAAKGKQVPGARMAQFILSAARDGDIILLHDTTKNNLDAVAPVIDGLRRRGFEFVTVEELFRLRGVTPQNGVAYKRIVSQASQDWDENALDRHWAWNAVRVMQSSGCMTGDGHGWYPNHYLSRETAVTALWRSCGSPEPVCRSTSFLDCMPGTPFADAVAWASEQGLIQGQSSRRFGVKDQVTREQLYVMVSRLLQQSKLPAPPDAAAPQYDDDDRISPYARDSVSLVRQLGFVSANDAELFRPRDYATRAEAAELFVWYRTMAETI